MKYIYTILMAVMVSSCTNTKESNQEPKFEMSKTGEVDYIPKYVRQPDYPMRAISQKKDGSCIVEFTIAIDGTTKNNSVLWSSSRVFNKACLKASKSIFYQRTEGSDELQEIPNVKYKYYFNIVK